MGIHRPRQRQRPFVRGSLFSLAIAPVLTRYICDDFVGTDTDPIDGRVPTIGLAWEDAGNSWEIDSNSAFTADPGSIFTSDAGHADLNVYFQMVATADRTEIIFRYVDTNNFWVGRVRDTAPATHLAEIVQIVGGVEIIKDAAGYADSAANPWNQITLVGNTIRFQTVFTDRTITDAGGAGVSVVGARSKQVSVVEDSRVLFFRCDNSLDGSGSVYSCL